MPEEQRFMGLDRIVIAQVLVSVIAVAIFVAGLVVISDLYGADTTDGGWALVGLIAFFIVLMPTFGFLVERLKDNGDENTNGSSS